MIRILIASLAFVCASAIVCTPDICQRVDCKPITAENCVGGRFAEKGGFCGCCAACILTLAEGDSCFATLLMGVPPTSECGEGLVCNPNTVKCVSIASLQTDKREVLTCAERLAQIQKATSSGLPLLGQQVPVCAADGTYAATQCHGSVCYCVDPSGNGIEGYSTNIGQAADMNCQCARDKYAYLQTGLIGKLFSCESNGNYKLYQCMGSVCYCTDNLGNMRLGSPTVNIGHLAELQC